MFSHTLVSVHLLDRRGNHFSSNPLINLPKGGEKNKKNQPQLLLNQFHVCLMPRQACSHFPGQEAGVPAPLFASFLQPPDERLASNEDRFYERVRSTLSQPGSNATCSSKLQHSLIRTPVCDIITHTFGTLVLF